MRAMQRQSASAQAGFTLLELIVAVAVFIILTALAVPSFVTYLDKARVRGAADSVVNQIAQARQVAVKFDRSVSLSTTGTGATWCVGANQAATPDVGSQTTAPVACDCTASPTTCLVDGREMVIGNVQHPGVTLSSGASELVFDGRLGARSDGFTGNADASSFDLTSQSGKYVLTVSVSPLGQAAVCSKTGNILGYPQC
jgi:type IV fimbrial biogenesis protein FimT